MWHLEIIKKYIVTKIWNVPCHWNEQIDFDSTSEEQLRVLNREFIMRLEFPFLARRKMRLMSFLVEDRKEFDGGY